MSSRLKEFLSVAAMLALTGFFFMLTPSDVADSGGSIFPNVIMALMLGLTVIKLAVDLLQPKSSEKQEASEEVKVNRPRFWVILVSIVVYVLAVDHIGFYVSSFIFFFGLTVAVQYEKRTPRSLAIRLAVVICFMIFLYVLFTRVLMAQLPKGILF